MDNRLGQAVLPTITNPQNLPISYMNQLDTKKSNIKGRNHRHIGLVSLLLWIPLWIKQKLTAEVPLDFQIFAIKGVAQTL